MVRTRVRWRRVAASAVAVALGMGLLASRGEAVEQGTTSLASQRVYVVRAGDTVWAIARRLGGAQSDPRPLVDQLIQANHLIGAVITPGEELVLPAS